MRELQAAFNACSISQPHTTVDATLCSTLPPAAAFRCTPQATAASSPALATVCEAIDTVSGVETDVSHNVRNCRDGMFIAFSAHFVVFSPCTAGSSLFTDPCFSPILGVSNHFQTVFPSCGTESSELVFSLSAKTEKNNLNMVFRLRWLCEGRACRVQPFMLCLSVFL